MERIKTDVLIIGGGSSGLWAAKGVKEKNPKLNVLIVDKSYKDWGGLMSLSGGDLEVCLPGDKVDTWVKDFVYYWDGLCEQDVMEELWNQSHEIFEEYQRLGCSYMKKDNGEYRTIPQRSLDCVKLFPVTTKGTGGINMRNAMVKEMIRLGVKRQGRIEITDIIKNDNRAVGAVGFNYVTGQQILFEAKAVILASGIAGWKPSYNQNTASGEGVSLAFNAGAKLRNFEFLHIWNVPKHFEWEGQTVLMPLGAKFVNKDGEVFMNKYSPVLGPNTDPHYITRAMTIETLEGRAPIYLDMSAIQEKDYPIIKPEYGRQLIHYNKLVDEGVDFFKDKFEWTTVVQFSNGAVETGKHGESGIDGLYIAGRLRSLDPGVYMGGFALMTTALTGRDAGRSAVDYITGSSDIKMDTELAQASIDKNFERLGKEGLSAGDLLNELQKVMAPYDVSILKTEKALLKAKERLEVIRKEMIPEMGAADPHYLLKAEEVKAIAAATDFYLTAALFREDSRAGHYRADFPEHYDDWLCWVVLENVDGKPVPIKRPVPVSTYKHPIERYYADNFRF